MKTKHIIVLLLIMLAGARLAAQNDSVGNGSGLGGLTPSAMKTTVEYNEETGDYVKTVRIGDLVVERSYMTLEEYQQWKMNELVGKYWDEKSSESVLDGGGEGLLSNIPGFSQISKKLDGINLTPKITPSGSVELSLGMQNNFRDDPQIPENHRNTPTFLFDENIQVNINAKIGDLLDFDINENTKATFDFENKIKLKYEGKEDDILQLFEAADISFPLPTKLIKGSQQLFGFHTKMKFGKLTVDAL